MTKADIVVKADYVLKMDRDLTLIRNRDSVDFNSNQMIFIKLVFN